MYKKDSVLECWLNRPEARNAISTAMEEEWEDILEIAQADDDIKVVTLQGRGKVFSAGADMKEYAATFVEGESQASSDGNLKRPPPRSNASWRLWPLPAVDNPMVSHSSFLVTNHPGKELRSAKQRGTKIIVVDPRVSETARLADLHLKIKPGEDPALFAGIIRHILDNDWHDQAFCDSYVQHLDELKKAVQPYTLEYVAARTGIPENDIARAAEIFATSRRKFIGSSTGPNMIKYCNLAEHLIESLNAICGAYRRAGDVVRNPGVISPRPLVETVVPPVRTWEMEPKLRAGNAGRLMGEFPTALLPEEILTPGEGKIRALIVYGGNPLMALPDTDKAIEAFKDLDLLVSIDPRTSGTAQLADYVIAPTVSFERHDVTTLSDITFRVPHLQYSAPVVSKPDGVIDDWEFFWHVAKQTGVVPEIKAGAPLFGMGYDQLPPGVAVDMTRKPSPEELLDVYLSKSRVSFDALKAAPQGVYFDELQETVSSLEESSDARLDVAPEDVCGEIDEYLKQPDAETFRYRFVVRRMLEVMNSTYLDSDVTRERFPHNFAYMNGEDMEENNLEDGDLVELLSDAGRVTTIAKSDKGQQKGVVSMTHLWGQPTTPGAKSKDDVVAQTGSHTARLVSGKLSTISFMPQVTSIPVNINRLGA